MIKQKLKAMTILSAGVLFALTSCEGAESIYDLDKAGEIEEVKKEIIEATGDILAYEITMTSQGELETSLDVIDIVTSENATEGTLNRKSFQLIGSGDPSVSVIDNDFFVGLYLKNEPKKISEIDFTLIETNIADAKAQIPSEYIDHSIYTYSVEFDDNKRADRFTINCLEEGESDHMEGRDVVTNYYEFLFEMDENGAVIMIMD
jgi:hypothetical protein